MSDILVRLPLTGQTDFHPLALAPGLPMLDARKLTFQVLLGWFGDVLADPELDEDGVTFHVQMAGTRRTVFERSLATERDLNGPLADQYERLKTSLFDVRPVSPSERLIFNRLQPPIGNYDGFLYRVKLEEGEDRLIWCWGFQRRGAGGRLTLCPNPECSLLFTQPEEVLDACPRCDTPFVQRSVAQRRRVFPVGAVAAVTVLAAISAGTYWIAAGAGGASGELVPELAALERPVLNDPTSNDPASNDPFLNAETGRVSAKPATGSVKKHAPAWPLSDSLPPEALAELPPADGSANSAPAPGNSVDDPFLPVQTTETAHLPLLSPDELATGGVRASEKPVSPFGEPKTPVDRPGEKTPVAVTAPQSRTVSEAGTVAESATVPQTSGVPESRNVPNKPGASELANVPEPASVPKAARVPEAPKAASIIERPVLDDPKATARRAVVLPTPAAAGGGPAPLPPVADDSDDPKVKEPVQISIDLDPNATDPVVTPTPERTVGELKWHEDYLAAYQDATNQRKLLLMAFRDPAARDNSESVTTGFASPDLQTLLSGFVRVTMPINSAAPSQSPGEFPTLLLEHRSFRHLGLRTGIAIVDLTDLESANYGRVVSALPAPENGRYAADSLRLLLSLPTGTVSERTLLLTLRSSLPVSVFASAGFKAELNELANRNARFMALHQQAAPYETEERAATVARLFGPDARLHERYFASEPGLSIQEAASQAVRNWFESGSDFTQQASNGTSYGVEMFQSPSSGRWFATCLIVESPPTISSLP